MATIPELRPIRLDGYRDVAPETETLVNTVNRFMREVIAALSALTFQQNFAASVQTVTFLAPADYATGGFTPVVIANRTEGSVSGVLLLRIVDFESPATLFLTAPQIANWSTDQIAVKINYVTGLTANKKYTTTVLVF